ncbi:MAG: nuclear transport factor 2 family protein [Bacteroidota bacterium]
MEQEFEKLLVEHLTQIWNERDEAVRLKVIEKIYAKDVEMYDMDEETFFGYDAINKKVSSLLGTFPPDFAITQSIQNVSSNNVAKLEWVCGAAGAPPVVTGTDIVFFEDGKIKSFYVFVNK